MKSVKIYIERVSDRGSVQGLGFVKIAETSKSSDKRSISVIFSSSNTCQKAGITVKGGHLSVQNSSQYSAEGLMH